MLKSQLVDRLKEGLESYNTILNKEIHYIYKKNGQYRELVLKAKKNDFMHLCGIESYLDPKTKKPVSASHFYELVKSNKISPSHLVTKTDGTTVLKLNVIEHLKELLNHKIRVIDDHVIFYNFSFDKGLRTGREIFALALVESSQHVHSPYSLLNLKSPNTDTRSIRRTYPVHSIFIRSIRGDEEVIYESSEYKSYKNK